MPQAVSPSSHADRVLFLYAMTGPRGYETSQTAYLCGLSPSEAELALSELQKRGLVVQNGEGGWTQGQHREKGQAAARFPEGDNVGGVLPYCALLREGRGLKAVEFLLTWAESRQAPRPAWALSFAVEEIVRTLLHTSLRDADESESSFFIELAIRGYSTADFLGLEPHGAKVLLLKARSVAFRLNNAGYLYILDTMLAVRKILLHNADVEPFEEGKGRLRLPGESKEPGAPDGMRGDSPFLADTMPYISLYKYLQGSARQALDHFSFAGGQEQPVSTGAGENTIPRGAFSSAFAALAAVQSGDAALAVSILKTSLNSNVRSANCTVRSWLHSHLATVYLATGKPDEALDHVDAALVIGIERNVQCWMAAYTALAHYHVLCGRPCAARTILKTAVEKAASRHYLWGYNSPWFLDMLYVFRRHGLADLPGYDLEKEIRVCTEGRNPLLRAVANRIKGDMLLHAGGALREVQLPLLRSRAFFKIQQLPAEKCKTCAVLARAYLAAEDRAQALRYAIEAWPYREQFLPLGIYWSPDLEKLLPAPHGTNKAGGDSGALWRQNVFQSLLHLNPENYEIFPQEILKCAVESLGAVRACLFVREKEGLPRMAYSLQRERKQGMDRDESVPLHHVKECLEGVPLCIMDKADAGRPARQILCIPVPDEEGRCYAVYVEADDFTHAEDIDDSFLLLLGESMGILFRRWNEAAGRAQETSRLLAAREGAHSHQAIIYSSDAMRRVLEQADTTAPTDASVLIYGESGVGKELLARRIHEKSGRSGPFVAVNLSSLPEELFESEMQGYERGAFTGAFQRKIGLLEMAHTGTLFIDEVPDISPRVQVKLLRLLQERTFMRLGSTKAQHSDFRLVVATNRNLFEEVRRGNFRSDLFYRLCVVPLVIPPLRERPEDIDALITHYLKEFSRRSGRPVPRIDPADALKLRAYTWPGNIRELRNVMARALILAQGGRAVFSFDSERFGSSLSRSPDSDYGRPEEAPRPESVDEVMRAMFAELPSAQELEKQYILTILRLTGGKVSGKNGAAELLGMSRSTLYDKMRVMGLSSSPHRRGEHSKAAMRSETERNSAGSDAAPAERKPWRGTPPPA